MVIAIDGLRVNNLCGSGQFSGFFGGTFGQAAWTIPGVSLAGVDSVMAPLALRERAWSRLAQDLDPAKLDAITTEVPLSGAIEQAQQLMAGKVRGRIVVRTGD